MDHSHFGCITKLTQKKKKKKKKCVKFINQNYILIVVHWGVEIMFCQWTHVKMKPQLNSTQFNSTLLYSTLQLCLEHWRNLYCGFKAWIVWHVNCAMFIYRRSPNLVPFINNNKSLQQKMKELLCAVQISFNSDPNQLELKHARMGIEKTPDFILLEPQIEFGSLKWKMWMWDGLKL